MAEYVYNDIGTDYNTNRQADIRIVSKIQTLLGLPDGAVIADIGAGTGNYSLALAKNGYHIKAVEPSPRMIKQSRPNPCIEWFKGTAEGIPLGDNSVDGVVIILAMHHFASLEKAADEIYRICPSGPIVIFTFDPRQSASFWFEDYFPKIWQQTYFQFLELGTVAEKIKLGKPWAVEQVAFPLPCDLNDRFMAAGWRNPEIYLDASVRQGMSGFALTDTAPVEAGIIRLKDDLNTGKWDEKYGSIRCHNSFDAGYRFLKFTVGEAR